MGRIHLFEFNDQEWFPKSLRRQGMELLASIFRITKIYAPTAVTINELIRITGEKKIIVLAAGSGGGILEALSGLPRDCEVVLTDIFPDRSYKNSDTRVVYDGRVVDATNPQSDLNGIRDIYTAFHHFGFEAARRLLRNATSQGEPIIIFEATQRTVRGIFFAALIPFLVIALTPFVRPWRWSRLLWTYVIPLTPVLALWDGLVSSLRSYSRRDFELLCNGLQNYEWRFEELVGPFGSRIMVTIGIPKGLAS